MMALTVHTPVVGQVGPPARVPGVADLAVAGAVEALAPPAAAGQASGHLLIAAAGEQGQSRAQHAGAAR